MDEQNIEIDSYVPALVAWIAQDLARGASKTYLRVANVGLETWRCMVHLGIKGSVSGQWICEEMRMDKSSVSKSLKELHQRGLIVFKVSPEDGRARLATLTKKGRAIHDKLRSIALERERALVSDLSVAERKNLLDLLNRLKRKLPEVETATEQYLLRELRLTTPTRQGIAANAGSQSASTPATNPTL